MKKITLLLITLISANLFAQDVTTDALKFADVLKKVNYMYVDSVNSEKMVEDAIRGMLKKLDPHSVYISAKDVKRADERLVGNFEGIGVQFNITEDTIVVVSPISGGPSEKLGIRSGDKIVEIEGENVAGIGIKNKDVMDKLRGAKGTKVTVGIKRKFVEEILDFTITRDKIPIFSRDAAYMATENIGYIKLNRFAATTIKEFREALSDLENKGMESLILDLRGNGGGYLPQALMLADEFLEKQELIVYTEGRSFPKKEEFATASGGFEKGKLVVLIDEGSASASEIVSGAIQDHDRGLIVGRRSFGKGLVQRQIKLSDGSKMRLTTQRYYTPAGRCVQKPYDDYKDDYSKRLERGEFFHKDSISFPDSLIFKTDNKRDVYGGGGIIPDVFVPLDTTLNSKYFVKISRKGLLSDYVLLYLNDNREILAGKYTSIELFEKEFDSEKLLLNDFIDYAEEKGVEKNEGQINTSKELILVRLKALIAREFWGTSGYFQIANTLNPAINKAIDLIENEDFKKLKIRK